MHSERRKNPWRVGLQVKVAFVLTLTILGVTAAGEWFYYATASGLLRSSDRRHAEQLTRALGVAAQHDLRNGRTTSLQRLASDSLRNSRIRFVAVLDDQGLPLATACGNRDPDRWDELVELPVSVSLARQVGDDFLLLAQPVVMHDVLWYGERLVGAVRVVVDTRETTARLARVRRRMGIAAGVIALCGLPMGYLLVWHLVVKPIRTLVAASGRLGRGEFHCRTGIRRSDEIGRLSRAFDTMADDLAAMRDELLLANQELEAKVQERTRELHVANGRLRSEMAEKEEFLRAVSHDLNAPLRNIAGMATLVMMKWRDELPEDVVARLQRIQANVDAETELIGELLELSRIRTRPQRREDVDFGALVAEVADTFDYELRSRDIAFTADEGMPVLHVERTRLRKVFQNLVDNAIKYMHREHGGRIHIGYRLADGLHEFHVADNGPGIPPDEQEKVFCVFRRASAAASGAAGGKGVGLAMVRSVVSNYDGRAWVESAEGEGSAFFVALGVENTNPADGDTPEEADAGRGTDADTQEHTVAFR